LNYIVVAAIDFEGGGNTGNKSLLVWLMVFNATFNNILVTSWWSVLLVEYSEKTTNLPKVTDKLYHIMLNLQLPCDHRHDGLG
jgi:hypothetical protein